MAVGVTPDDSARRDNQDRALRCCVQIGSLHDQLLYLGRVDPGSRPQDVGEDEALSRNSERRGHTPAFQLELIVSTASPTHSGVVTSTPRNVTH